MNDSHSQPDYIDNTSRQKKVDEICCLFEEAWKSEQVPLIEDYLQSDLQTHKGDKINTRTFR